MYSFLNLEPVHCSIFGFNCCFLTLIQVSQEAGQVVWDSHLLKNSQQFIVIHTVQGLCIVNEAKVDVFLESSCFFYDLVDVGNLVCGSSAFSKSSLYIWKSSLKPSLKDFEHYLAGIWNQCNWMVISTFLALPFFDIGMKTDLSQSCGHCWVFQIFWHIECSTLTAPFL